jgi:hypothetical protein
MGMHRQSFGEARSLGLALISRGEEAMLPGLRASIDDLRLCLQWPLVREWPLKAHPALRYRTNWRRARV